MDASKRGYETGLIALLCAAVGIVNIDMFGINYLMPAIRPALQLTNVQVGALISSFWVTYAVSCYLTGQWMDRIGRRKRMLVLLLVLIGGGSVLAGFTRSFVALLAVRMLMGLLEGPLLPLVQSLVAIESAPERKGLNMGIVQTFGASLLGWLAAPIVLAWLAAHHGWRTGFFLVIGPALLCAAAGALFLREPPAADVPAQDHGPGGVRDLLGIRNIWLCGLLSALAMAYLAVGAAFLPLYAVQIRHMDATAMGLLMSVLGLSSLVLGIVIPALSDRFGRKPVAILANLVGMLCPAAMIGFDGGTPLLAALMFVGWASAGASTLYFATIPAESAPMRLISTAIGLNIGAATLLGGVVAPTAAGWLADRHGVGAALALVAGCAGAMALLTFALKETGTARHIGGPRLAAS
ncbi:MFS transporter [Sphingomonas sp. C8-2]|jgi:MFS family permease|uniref:Sugar phosphate permease n=1 Tax=Rhizorhabdus histidinilytica TaxID=439228 RepID=A0A1T5EM28_9SPHN|nr:MFS transporter [Rhizorhabdus histidinilytica]QEH76827.1 MFS transporter [Sphingomonas sp. C8-2]SKB85112.1 Sugar phosphate permease [Rhizorhabdus histidinilytica]